MLCGWMLMKANVGGLPAALLTFSSLITCPDFRQSADRGETTNFRPLTYHLAQVAFVEQWEFIPHLRKRCGVCINTLKNCRHSG